MPARSKWHCLDCGVDTGKIGEHYFISTETWLGVVASQRGMLCIGCLEVRLGRRLTQADFTNSYINNQGNKSLRLVSRLRGE